MLLENELLFEAEALINSNEEVIAQVESDLNFVPGCTMCGYGTN